MTSTLAELQSVPESTPVASPREFRWTVDAFARLQRADILGRDGRHGLRGDRLIAPDISAEHHWTAAEFTRASDLGVFGLKARLELVHGRIRQRMGQGLLHFTCRLRMGRLLRAVRGAALTVAEECPILISFDGAPVADVVVLAGSHAVYEERLPTSADAALVIEIAVSSADVDLGGKASLYAQAGIPEYWVALPEAGEIVTHRDPTPQGHGSVTRLDGTASVTPVVASDVSLAARDLFGPAG